MLEGILNINCVNTLSYTNTGRCFTYVLEISPEAHNNLQKSTVRSSEKDFDMISRILSGPVMAIT